MAFRARVPTHVRAKERGAGARRDSRREVPESAGTGAGSMLVRAKDLKKKMPVESPKEQDLLTQVTTYNGVSFAERPVVRPCTCVIEIRL
jgi:hypothetical protein